MNTCEIKFVRDHHETLLADYFRAFGDLELQARHSKWSYKPKEIPLGIPNKSFQNELRQLSSDIADVLVETYNKFFEGGGGLSKLANAEVAALVSSENRANVPSMVRLDVVAGEEGLRVVEINGGNAGGAAAYSLYKEHLVKCYGAKICHGLPEAIDKLHIDEGVTRVVSLYIGETAMFLSRIRNRRIEASNPGVSCELAPVRVFDPELAPDAGYYLDFLLSGMRRLPNFDKLVSFFTSSANLRTVSPLCDRFMSDKSLMSEFENLLSPDGVQKANRWILPTCTLSKGTNFELSQSVSSSSDRGVVLKPVGGCGGRGLTILPGNSIPINHSFFGDQPWVAQPFVPPSTARDEATGQNYNVIYGVFLVRQGEALRYAGTTIRLAPDLVVNLGNSGKLGLLLESEWDLKM